MPAEDMIMNSIQGPFSWPVPSSLYMNVRNHHTLAISMLGPIEDKIQNFNPFRCNLVHFVLGLWWSTLVDYGLSWSIMVHLGASWSILVFHGSSWSILLHLGLSWHGPTWSTLTQRVPICTFYLVKSTFSSFCKLLERRKHNAVFSHNVEVLLCMHEIAQRADVNWGISCQGIWIIAMGFPTARGKKCYIWE